MVKIGLIGLGYLGKIHLRLLSEIEGIELKGVYDIDTDLCKRLASDYQIRAYKSRAEMIGECDAIDIVTPGNTHFEIASDCIKNNKHVFIEKPATSTLNEAKQLQRLENKSGICIQVGHVERFNPAYIAAKPYIKNIQNIEFQRYAIYNPRGTDVSVTLDLMIHDLDLLLNLVKSPVKNVHAEGKITKNSSADLARASIEFENGCTAFIQTDRNACENSRKFTVYQHNTTIEVDLLNKITKVSSLNPESTKKTSSDLVFGKEIPEKNITAFYPQILPTNAIKEELSSFVNSIITARKPIVTIEDAIDVLNLAFSIDEKILIQMPE